MNEPLETIARTIVVALAVGVAYSALLAAFVLAVIRMTGASAATRHVLWWLALAASAAIPVASVASSFARMERHTVLVATIGATASHGRIAPMTADAARAGAATAIGIEPMSLAATLPRVIDIAFANPHAAQAAVALWLGVVLAGWVALATSFASLRALKRASTPLDEPLARRLRRFRHSARSGRAVELRVSDDVDVPVAVGFRTPAIIIPTTLASGDDTLAATGDLDQIVLHEYAHLERYDDWTNALQLLLVRAFWFNPFVAFFATRIALEREIASDDWVVARTGRAHRYATCLWKLVEAVKLPTRRIVAPGALFSPRQITVRIEQLLDSRRSALQRFSPFGASLTVVVAIALVVVQAVRAPAIAIDVALPAPPQAAAAAPREIPAPLAVAAAPAAPHVALTPAPIPVAPRARVHGRERRERHERLTLHGIPVEATPDAIAKAVATAVATQAHAIVETTVSRISTGPDSYADEIGIDVARQVQAAVKPIAHDVSRDLSQSVVADVTGGEGLHTFPRSCTGCDLSHADLHGRDLHGVSWSEVDVNHANLSNVNFRGANLNGVDFHNADLDGADLTGAHLSGCDLHGASLRGTRLNGASITMSDLHGTDIHDADTRGASIVNSAD